MFQKLATALADLNEKPSYSYDFASLAETSLLGFDSDVPRIRTGNLESSPSRIVAAAGPLQSTPFWSSEKAFLYSPETAAVAEAHQARGSPSPPDGAAIGVDLIRGHLSPTSS